MEGADEELDSVANVSYCCPNCQTVAFGIYKPNLWRVKIVGLT